MLRLLSMIALLAGGGAFIGRRALDGAINERLSKETEAAKRLALEELDKSASTAIRERLLEFLFRSAVKASLLGFFVVLHRNAELTAVGLQIVVAALIGLFIMADAFRLFRPIMMSVGHLRKFAWRPRAAFKEFIAAIAFERAYATAIAQLESDPARFAIYVSSFTREELSKEIASSVEELARLVSIERLAPRILFALFIAMAIFALYVGFIFFAFRHAG